jgi:hypothetical protein
MAAPYRRAAMGDVEGCWRVIEEFASAIEASVGSRAVGNRQT